MEENRKYTYEIKMTEVPRTCKECDSYHTIARKCTLAQCKYADRRGRK